MTTTHGAIRVNATGQFGVGAGNHIQVLADANVPLGNAEVRADGMVFSYSNGNIRLDATHWRGATTPRPTITPDSEQSHSVPPPVLPAPGRYSASTFVTNTDGVATSTTKVLSVTI